MPSLSSESLETTSSPYINRFLQPDTIIPDLSNPQSWNRYSYAENDPINYSDSSGHFKCKNNSTSFDGDCHKVIETYLSLLEEKGGKDGQALVKAFREADTAHHYDRGGGYDEEDQITITIEEGGGGGGYLGGLNFSLSAYIMNNSSETDSLVHSGQLGHEIVHLTQDDIMDRMLYMSSGSLYDEIDAYGVQSKIYKNMGLTTVQNGTVAYAAEIASYKNKSKKEILGSSWARADYKAFPLFDGGSREFDNWWYLEKPSIKPLPLHLFHGD